MNVKKLTAETIGIIIQCNTSPIESPRLTVSYEVNGQKYKITENVTSKSETIRLGFLPVGQKKVWLVKNIQIGEQLEIVYDPNHPQKGHIKGNDGKYC